MMPKGITPILGIIDVPLNVTVTAFGASETASVHRSLFPPQRLSSNKRKEQIGYDRLMDVNNSQNGGSEMLLRFV